jgi:chemotaxis protein CheX
MAGRAQSTAKAAAPRKKAPPRAKTPDVVEILDVVEAAADDGAAVVRLQQVLDLNAAGPLAAELLAVRGRDVEVDASAVERVGAQCLQVLLSARATWDADGATFALVSPSDEFASTLALLGAPIDQHFNSGELSA